MQNTIAQAVRVIHADLRQLDYLLCDDFVAKIGTAGKSECFTRYFERETHDANNFGIEFMTV